MLDLGPLERRRYLSSGLIAVAREQGLALLDKLESLQARVDFQRTFFAENDPDYPLLYLEQDLLNAVLATRPAEEVDGLASRMMSPLGFGAPEIVDTISLRCAYPDGTEPYVVHHILPRKPWLRPMYHGVYSRLLMRLLIGPDLRIRVPERSIPVHLRDGSRARLARARIHARDRLGWFAREHFPDGVFDRLDRIRGGAAAR